MENYVIRFDETRVSVEMLEGMQEGRLGAIVSYVASQLWDNDEEVYVSKEVGEEWVRSLSLVRMKEMIEEINEQMKNASILSTLLEGLG